jgi:hypothetical protein
MAASTCPHDSCTSTRILPARRRQSIISSLASNLRLHLVVCGNNLPRRGGHPETLPLVSACPTLTRVAERSPHLTLRSARLASIVRQRAAELLDIALKAPYALGLLRKHYTHDRRHALVQSIVERR